MKKKLSLIVVLILSVSLFITNMAGLRLAVQAADEESLGDLLGMDFEDPVPEAQPQEQQTQTQEQPQAQPQPQPEVHSDQSDDVAAAAAAEAQRQAEEAAKQAAEQQRQADEAARKQAEEEAKKAYEAELAKQAEQAAKEEEKRQAEQAAKEQAAKDAEAAKQAALEQAAKEAEEAAKKQQEEDAAAAAAKKLAEEEAAKAKEQAEKAEKAAEEAKKQAQSGYSLRLVSDGGSISSAYLSGTVGEGDYVNFSVVNNGSTDVDLIYGISGASADVFGLSMTGGSTSLSPSDSARFQITLKPSAPVGSYSAKLYFKDKLDTENKNTIILKVSADVRRATSVSRVTIYPRSITLAQGADCDFFADVNGSEGISQEVTWGVTGMRSNGTYITNNGLLVIGSNETASSISVIATSRADSRYSDRVTVGIQSGSYNVKVSADPQKGGIVTGGGAVQAGGSVTVSAVPNKNYYFEGWMRDGKKVSTSTNYKIDNVRSNITVTAKFKQNYVTITAVSENDQAGSVVGGGKVSYGGKTTLSAKAKDGYVFTGWQEGNNIVSNSASIELHDLTVDRKLVAKFSKTSFYVSVAASPAEGGALSGNGTYSVGASATLNAVPANGYVFQSWNLNGQIVSRSPSFKIDRVDKDYNFTAIFLPTGALTHTISAGVATTGGMINPSGVTVVARGQNVTYTITPKSGFAILAVAVDGVQVGPVTTYTFQNVTGDHSIAAAFVQTDAGAKAAQAAGEAPQPKKVQAVAQTEKNTATPDQTVNLDDAASGTAGDEFVEEMDLSDIPIPTDEELGMTDEFEMETYSEVLKALGITLDDAKMMIANGQGLDIMAAAFYEGSLDFNVDNQYAPAAAVPDYHALSREELELLPADDVYPDMPNLDAVSEKILTANDLLDIADGGRATIAVSVTNADNNIDESSKKVLSGAVGQKPLQYFDLTVVKMVDGDAENVKLLSEPMEVVMEIPNEIYKSGKTYNVLRVHDGELSVLPDLDDDPKTITFRTDRLSSYAIAEQQATSKEIAVRFAIGALIALVVALISLVILLYTQVRSRRTARAKKRRG
ncbi:MAG: cell envelope integrity protein TolA [Lachnospiraceae bacterium]|nr:cell envelope integrity protein TolA [Lachnospiraceae bacterium]